MFFIVSKILGPLFEPLNFLILVGVLGLVLVVFGLRRSGFGLAATSLVVFAIVGFSPLSSILLRPIEDRFPPPPKDMPAPSGILVLGGALNEDLALARGQVSLNEAAERLTAAVALSRRFPETKLVFTGGSASLRQTGDDEAKGVRRLWLDLGVPAERMTFEDKSRNTYENAVMTREIVHPRAGERWLLVTSAYHMPRSVGIFRKAGWPVVAYPVDFRTFGDSRDFNVSFSALDSFQRLEPALHEWIGLVAYRLTGKTDALFPAP